MLGEFDVGSVTSPSLDAPPYSFLPNELYSAAFVGGGYDGGLRYAQLGKKGFLLVKLTKKTHHAEYIHVSTICSTDYFGTCSAAFDWYSKDRRRKLGNVDNIVKSTCRRVPRGTPYEAIRRLNSEIGQGSSFLG